LFGTTELEAEREGSRVQKPRPVQVYDPDDADNTTFDDSEDEEGDVVPASRSNATGNEESRLR
jgi:hypothetical protein